jgi:beta-N-acetylhexosaminidase
MAGMTLREKIAQLIFIPFHGTAYNSRSREYRDFVRLIRDTRVGGLILVNWSNGRLIEKAEPYALGAFLNRMQRLAKVPLLVSADFERGASMRVDGTTAFPHAMAFGATGDPALSRREGEITAREARALGIHWVFYPVADVNNNPENPIINIRSFGENPEAVAAHVRAFIEGARSDRRYAVLSTAKHFPGHGDTAIDSHLNLAVIGADRERLDRVELAPFRAAIAAGVDSIMTAHIAVPALAAPDLPATLSAEILTTLLRGTLGFKGLIVTDALEMGGIAKGYSAGDAAVRALEAGVDALLMTPDPDAAINAILAAVRSGRLSRKRIDQSVARILAAKERLALHGRRYVNLEAISDVVDAPESNETAREVAERALTLVRNQQLIPLPAPEQACFVILPESRYASQGMAFTREVRERARGASIVSLDPSMPAEAIDYEVKRMSGCGSFVIAAFSAAGAYRGDLALGGELNRAVDSLISTGKPVALAALGNPYLLTAFPKVAAYLAAFSTVPPSEVAVVRALFGEIGVSGRLPVSIPGLAQYGEGMLIPAPRPVSTQVSQ